jgi:hypothetical protein
MFSFITSLSSPTAATNVELGACGLLSYTQIANTFLKRLVRHGPGYW